MVNNYPPQVGGVERHVASLAETLVAGGDRATVLVLDDGIGTSIVNGVTVIRIAQWLRVASVLSFPRPGASRKILAIVASLDVSAISTHTRFFPMSFIGIRLAKKLGVAAIHTEHGSGFVRGLSLPIAIASRLVDITVGRYVLRSATAVLAVSEAVSEFVAHLSGASAQVFYNAITLNQWPHRPANQAETRFVFVGRLVPGKGWDAALEAAAWLATQHPLFRFSLDIVGDGPSADQVAALVAKLELQNIVTLHGQVAAHELSKIMGGAILVNPTTLAEGFQTSLVEAIATGCSVVTYAVPGAQLLLDDGAPVSIVSDHSTETLAAAMIFAAQYPLPPYSAEKMAQWDWSTRAKQYLALVDAAQNKPVQNRASRINKTRQRQK